MASILDSALRRFGVTLGVSAAKRQVEEALEPILERAIRTGMDENATLREMALATRNIPGLRVASHAAVSAAGAVLAEHADDLWPGRTDPFTKSMRVALKRLGPSLHFASDIGADALEKAVKAKADGIISPATAIPSDRKAELDQGVFLWPGEFPNRFLVPARNDDGTIKFDAQNLPIILDPEVMTRRHQSKYTTSSTRTVSGGKGQPSRQVTDPPQRPDFIGPFALRDAVQMVDMGRMDPAAAEAIQKLLAPKPGYFQSWGDDVWEVIRAYNAAFTRRKAETGYDWLDQEESEGLVQTMLKAQPDVTLLRELVGKRFKARIGQNGARPGELSLEDCNELEQVVFDMWLGGEQPVMTKLVRRARRVRRSGAIRGLSPFGVVATVAGITSPIWMPLVGFVLVLLVSVLMFVQGVFTPVTGGTVPFLGTAYDSKAFAMGSVFLAGWLAFVVTWFFPIFQTATSWVRTLFPSLKEDWLASLGRRIVAFALLFCSGIEFYAVALNVAPIWRVVVLAVAGVGVAVAMGLAEAGYRYQAEEMVKNAAKPTIIAFGIIPLLMVFTVGVWQGNPAQASATTGWLSGLFAALHWWHYVLAFGALCILLLLAAMLFGGGSKEGKNIGGGTSERAMNLASMMLGGGAFLAVLFLGGWMLLAGLHEIGSWFDGSPVSASVPTQADNGPWFDRAAMCADPVTTFEQRQILRCP